MTRTRRGYNNPHSSLFVHPYRCVCMGRCPFCRDSKLEPKQSRLQRERDLRRELKEQDLEDGIVMWSGLTEDEGDDDSGDLPIHVMLWGSLIMVGFIFGVCAMFWAGA